MVAVAFEGFAVHDPLQKSINKGLVYAQSSKLITTFDDLGML